MLQAVYRPILDRAFKNRKATIFLALLLLLSALWPTSKIGSEFMPPLYEGDLLLRQFMPPLYEGDLLYMPTTLPGISIDEAANILQITDRLIRQMPEVERVYGKAGKADTALDP